MYLVASLHRSNVAASNGVAHKYDGSIDNAVAEKRSLDPTQARETCVLCCRLLDRACFWSEQWRHRKRSAIPGSRNCRCSMRRTAARMV